MGYVPFFKFFALTAVIGGEGNCPGGVNMCKCARGKMSYTLLKLLERPHIVSAVGL